MRVVTLTGSNSFRIGEELKKRLGDFARENGEMSIERIDAETVDISDLFSHLSSPSLFAPKKLTVIRNLSRNSELAAGFIDLLNQEKDLEVLLVESKIDARGKLYKSLKEKTEFIELGELKPHELSRWVEDSVFKYDGKISSANALYLVNRVGPNQESLDNELRKLILYSPEVTKDTIDLLVEPGIASTTFDLANAAFNHDREVAIRLYREQRSLKIDPAVIIGSLAWQLHVLALIKTSDKRNPEQIARDSGMSPWAISKAKYLADRVSYEELVSAINLLMEIDTRSKSSQINIDDALTYYLLRIS